MIEVYGLVTNIGRRYMSASLMSSFNFTVTDYAVGDQGHDQNNPRISLTPNLNQVAYNGGFPLLHGPAPLDLTELVAPHCSRYTFTMQRGQVVGEWSQINLIATVISSPGSLPDGMTLPGVGEQFLFAIVNRPLVIQADIDEPTYAITVRF